MVIAGAVIVPQKNDLNQTVSERLDSLMGVEVISAGEKGIAVTMESDSTHKLKKMSKEINKWDEVLDFQIAYLNCEEELEGTH